jgi:3-dehydroquinate synthase
MEHIVVESARIKADVVAADEREDGLRMILNYGHTVGHAFEAATDYKKFKHGEAVAWGMAAALEYGRELGFLKADECARLIRLIHRVGVLPSLKGIGLGEIWNALIRDKKFRAGDIRMVFLSRPGNAEIWSGIEADSLRSFLKKFLARSGYVV